MSDPRFARLKTDPRFRKPRSKANKVVIDDRFKSLFDNRHNKHKTKAESASVDKYGRKLSSSHDTDNLKRFYRLEDQEPDENALDYARGEVLMESSDEEDRQIHDGDSDDGEVLLGRDIRKPITVLPDEPEVDLDESQFAMLDALAAVNTVNSTDDGVSGNMAGEQTNRLAVVNLDWDHVRASHLFKIFSSLVSPSPPMHPQRDKTISKVSKGQVITVQIYPSEFGKMRLERERKEGPPKELFKTRDLDDEDQLSLVGNEDDNEYDGEALRKYQLERLRYYYAIVTCDTVATAVHIYSELDGTELERSANIFDLSFVPNNMTFDDEISDEATQEPSGAYNGVEFVTDALRHSKVKLTWDDDDPERNKITRRTLSRKEIEESDFKAYLASSGSSEEGSEAEAPVAGKRDKLRALLLGDGDEDHDILPDSWGKDIDKTGEMDITFTPGLSGARDDTGGDEETTLQQYLRKQKERRKQKKTAKAAVSVEGKEIVGGAEDEFFDEGDEHKQQQVAAAPAIKGETRNKQSKPATHKHVESTPAELELVLTSVEPSREPKHFDMRSVIKAEKAVSRKRGKRDKSGGVDKDDAQEEFSINVKDDRFKALHDNHAFAIDPTNPHFKKTKSMSALLEERTKRQRHNKEGDERQEGRQVAHDTSRTLKSLVESVKRKSASINEGGGKRRKF